MNFSEDTKKKVHDAGLPSTEIEALKYISLIDLRGEWTEMDKK